MPIGTYKHTKEHNENISKGLKKSWEEGRRIINPNFKHSTKHSKESKLKMSDSIIKQFLKGRIVWNKGKRGLQSAWNKGLPPERQSNFGRHWSEEIKEKIRLSNLGQKRSEETKKKISIANQNRSEETRRKLSLAHKGKTYEQIFGKEKAMEIKRNISDASKGKIISEENKKKMSLRLNGKTWEQLYGKEKAEKMKRKLSIVNQNRSEETINKIKKARAKQILPIKDTTIEVKIQNFLKKLGREFFTHQYMNIEHGYQCDIYIPSINLVIECDGDYWHKYPTGREIDHIRTSELIKKGFKVLRLWEHEIRVMNINQFSSRLKGDKK